jgi:hypothetical protein
MPAMRRKTATQPEPEARRSATSEAPAPLDAILVGREARVSNRGPTALTGHLEGIDAEGRLLFRPEGHAGPPVPVAIGIEASDAVLVKAARLNRRAMVIATSDPESRWVLTGLVKERVTMKAKDARPGRLELEVDGETVRLSAEHVIELRCGKSSLLLRRDGKIVLSGDYVVSASRGPNKIRGATISLN